MGYINTSSDYKYYHGVICNFLDTPLILLFLPYFQQNRVLPEKIADRYYLHLLLLK